MTYPSSDPYATPSALPPKPGMEPPKLRYFESFQYIFAHPEWTTSVLLAAVCMLIPVLNQILMQGYMFEIVESFHRYPGHLYPKFDFNRFSQYLMRGVWPFLVGMIVGFIVQMPLFCGVYGVFVAGMIAFSAGGGRESGEAAMLIMMPCMYLSIFAIIIIVQILAAPFLLRAGLSQDFAQSFKFNWVMDFLKKMWLELILAQLFLGVVTLFVVIPLSCATLLIGLLPLGAMVFMAHGHLLWQIYTIYLARGGEPIPLKPWDGPAPMMPTAM
jgi:hypothetical protein